MKYVRNKKLLYVLLILTVNFSNSYARQLKTDDSANPNSDDTTLEKINNTLLWGNSNIDTQDKILRYSTDAIGVVGVTTGLIVTSKAIYNKITYDDIWGKSNEFNRTTSIADNNEIVKIEPDSSDLTKVKASFDGYKYLASGDMTDVYVSDDMKSVIRYPKLRTEVTQYISEISSPDRIVNRFNDIQHASGYEDLHADIVEIKGIKYVKVPYIDGDDFVLEKASIEDIDLVREFLMRLYNKGYFAMDSIKAGNLKLQDFEGQRRVVAVDTDMYVKNDPKLDFEQSFITKEIIEKSSDMYSSQMRDLEAQRLKLFLPKGDVTADELLKDTIRYTIARTNEFNSNISGISNSQIEFNTDNMDPTQKSTLEYLNKRIKNYSKKSTMTPDEIKEYLRNEEARKMDPVEGRLIADSQIHSEAPQNFSISAAQKSNEEEINKNLATAETNIIENPLSSEKALEEKAEEDPTEKTTVEPKVEDAVDEIVHE